MAVSTSPRRLKRSRETGSRGAALPTERRVLDAASAAAMRDAPMALEAPAQRVRGLQRGGVGPFRRDPDEPGHCSW
jgi:hypothetical protein